MNSYDGAENTARDNMMQRGQNLTPAANSWQDKGRHRNHRAKDPGHLARSCELWQGTAAAGTLKRELMPGKVQSW